LLEQFARGDTNAVVRGRDVHDVRCVDVEPDPGLLGGGAQTGGTTRVVHHRALPVLRVAEEDLDDVARSFRCGDDRVLPVYVRTELRCGHAQSVRRTPDTPPAGGRLPCRWRA